MSWPTAAGLRLLLSFPAVLSCARAGIGPTSSGAIDLRPHNLTAAAAPAGAYDPRTAGVITLLSVELPEAGTNIGGHFAGVQYHREVNPLQLGDGTRQRWMRTSRESGDSILIAAGFRVQRPGARSSDAELLRGVRFGLAAQVTMLRLKTIGYVEPFTIEGTAHIEWELLDLAAGAAVFEGSSEATVRGSDSLDAAVNGVVALALSRLLDQSDFRRAIATPRPIYVQDLIAADFARTMPAPGDTITLAADAQNMSPESGILGGVVALNGTRQFSVSAIVLTRDGLALTHASAGRQRWLWARQFDNRNRAVRVVRVAGEVALVELACVELCETVMWAADSTLRDHARVLAVGGRSVANNAAMGITYRWRALRVRRDRAGVTSWKLRGRPTPLNGEAIARDDGVVVGIAVRTGVMSIGDALRALDVKVTTLPK